MARASKILTDGLFLGAFLILASLIVAKLDLAQDERLSGPFFAIDGDTLAAGAERLRLEGIDAPEAGQTCGDGNNRAWSCGDAARNALAGLTASAEAECSGHARDRYGRVLVACRLGSTSINGRLVEEGLAVAAGDFEAEEQAARAARRGIWAGEFESPKAWRRSRGSVDDDEAVQGLLAWLRRLFGWS